MKSLLLSDIHASYRLLSQVYETFKDDKSVKSLIFCGDLVDMGEPVAFVDEFLWLVEQLDIELIWVPGNNDFGRAYHRFNARSKSVEGKILESSGRKFTGVGGSPASWSGQYEGEMSVDKKAIAGTIFLSHVPPPGIAHYEKLDRPPIQALQGDSAETIVPESDSIFGKKYNNKKLKFTDAPLVHICGHIHHTWGVGHLGSTKVIKLAAAYLGYVAMLDMEDLTVKFDNIFK